jgi:hypothetical protein
MWPTWTEFVHPCHLLVRLQRDMSNFPRVPFMSEPNIDKTASPLTPETSALVSLTCSSAGVGTSGSQQSWRHAVSAPDYAPHYKYVRHHTLWTLALAGGPLHSWNTRHRRFSGSGEETSVLSLPGNEPWFLGCPARSTVTMLTELSWFQHECPSNTTSTHLTQAYRTDGPEVLGSNLSLDTDNLDVLVFLSFHEISKTVPRLCYDRFLPNPFQFITRHIIQRYSLNTDSVVK